MADLLFELGCEELPAVGLRDLAIALRDCVITQLEQANIGYEAIEYFVSPRRLVVYGHKLQEQQPDQKIERKGPSKQAAYDADGNPTKALQGFLKSCDASVEELIEEQTEKGCWLIYKGVKPGQPTIDLLPEVITQAVKKLPLRKPMRWAAHEYQFLRPVHWIVALFGKDVVPVKLFGLESDRYTYGHRFMAPRKYKLKQPEEYINKLTTKGKVIASFLKRRKVIAVIAKRTADEHDARALIDADLLAEVAGLVEWPYALLANFDEKYLQVPREALIACMQNHQKVFPVVDNENNLLPHFITISNISSNDPASIIHGNEKVMHARLADAAFFYHNDIKKPLAEMYQLLANVSFQKQLGNMQQRALRIEAIAKHLTNILELTQEQTQFAQRAAYLCKCDLMSEMVYEFPELQGIMGYYYAQYSGENDEVATAIRDHYLPKFAGDELPTNIISSIVAIADKVDLLAGIFGIGQIPTGDKDPFALRRATNGLIHIIIENKVSINLKDLLQGALGLYGEKLTNSNALQDLMTFISERLRSYYREQNIEMDVFNSVMAIDSHDLLDCQHRISAVLGFLQLPEAKQLAEANKRVHNILQKNDASQLAGEINQSTLVEMAEIELAKMVQEQRQINTPLAQQHDYEQILFNLAKLQQPIDQFFDQVMVMADDPGLRNNRLLLLNQIRQLFLMVADISLLN